MIGIASSSCRLGKSERERRIGEHGAAVGVLRMIQVKGVVIEVERGLDCWLSLFNDQSIMHPIFILIIRRGFN
jgi:hypothetical protein